MKSMLMLASLLAAGMVSPALAANAAHPYQNCDKKIDNCGPTGNSTTDQLNGQQLGGAATTDPAPMDATPAQPGMPAHQ